VKASYRNRAIVLEQRKAAKLKTPKTDSIFEPEEPFRLLVENSNDILTIREADGRVRYTNPTFYRLLGYKQEEIIGSTCFELLHPEDREEVMTALDELLKTPGGRDSVQCRARHADGFWMTFEIVASNLVDHPEVRGLVVNGRHIDERAQQEAEKEQLVEELKGTLAGLNTLAGILSICASCKKIQTEGGDWQQIEAYVRERTRVEFSHGMCPKCVQLWFLDGPKR
jgi:PAS domain S-box-containing protein